MQNKTIATFDTECFPNYWMLGVQVINGGNFFGFELHIGQSLTPQNIADIRCIFEHFTVVSFNGRGYDIPMISGALSGYTAEQLKMLNDRIIVEGVKPWELGLPEWEPKDHIDVMEVAPGQGSQKQYAGRIHSKLMQDLPYEVNRYLNDVEKVEVFKYNGNDLRVLEELWHELQPQIKQRIALNEKYNMSGRDDLRSKSDAQVAEAVLKKRCEIVMGRRLYKADIDWNMMFQYRVPEFISFSSYQLKYALNLVIDSIFGIGANGMVGMPSQLDNLEITIGSSTYKMGIGGLHSQEKRLVVVSDEHNQLRMPDVASYYPNLILNSGEYPPALGKAFIEEFGNIKDTRLACKAEVKRLKKLGLTDTVEYEDAKVGDGGGKLMINGTFGKTGSPWSILFAPVMLIQTTITGQLALLMLIEWHETCGIPVVSANTDGIVIRCPRNMLWLSEYLIKEWEKATGLEMETDDYVAIYARDVNNYYAIKTVDDVKRKGEYAKSGLVEKKNPDVEICSDAVERFLTHGVPLIDTIRGCADIRKFVTIQRVNGGGVKMWGEGFRKGIKVSEMTDTLIAHGWVKSGRSWSKNGMTRDATTAYKTCFAAQTPEYLGKVVRWYYSTQAPGAIVYATNGNMVSMSYGARPCMTLPDEIPSDIDYNWYLKKSESILYDIGYTIGNSAK